MRTALAAALLVACTLLAGCAREGSAWEAAQRDDTEAAYRDYLARYPAGAHAAKAAEALAARAFAQVKAARSREACERFQREFPGAPQQAEAAALHDELTWLETTVANRPEAFRAYLAAHPTGRWAAAARRRLAEIDADRLPVLEGAATRLAMDLFESRGARLLAVARASACLVRPGSDPACPVVKVQRTVWEVVADDATVFEGVDAQQGPPPWTAGARYRVRGAELPREALSPAQARRQAELGIRVLRAAVVEALAE